MKKILLFSVLLIIATGFTMSDSSKLSPLFEKLNFMEGTWEGNGWIIMNEEKKEFVQNEVIEFRIDSTILVIDGMGYSKEGEEVTDHLIHDAFGVISFNEEKQAITMLTFSTTGSKMENTLNITGNQKLEWSFKDENGGTVRFREDFSEDGLWIEKGDYSFDGEKWFPFFEMRLAKH